MTTVGQPMKHILIADDHTLFRRGLSLVLQNIFEGVDIIEADDADSALKQISEIQSFDLILLDLSMPGMEDLQGLEAIIEKAGKTPTAILSAHQNPQSIRMTIEKGAKGYLLKSFSEESLRHALALVMAGEVFVPSSILMSGNGDHGDPVQVSKHSKENNPLQSLTRRQNDVLRLIMKGQSNKIIARSLGLYESTVKAHIQVILEKLNADNRTHAAMIASEWLGNNEGSEDSGPQETGT